MWAPANKVLEEKKNLTDDATAIRSKAAKHRKNPQDRVLGSRAERLKVDVLDWDTCSEGDLLIADADDEEDWWIYYDISDSEFDS